MRMVKVGLSILVMAIFMSGFFSGTAHAQGVDETIWEGTWFKLNTNFKGYERNLAGSPDWFSANYRFTIFANILTWNGPGFSAVFWYYDDDIADWVAVPIDLYYIHGTPLDLLIFAFNDQGDIFTGDGEALSFAARITGKLDKTGEALQTGKFKSLGGYFIEIDTSVPLDPIYQGSGVTMTGTLIPANFCASPKNQQYPPCGPL
jgi:hypothetical protein